MENKTSLAWEKSRAHILTLLWHKSRGVLAGESPPLPEGGIPLVRFVVTLIQMQISQPNISEHTINISLSRSHCAGQGCETGLQFCL